MNTFDEPKPTRNWKPSARDEAIYRAVVIEGRTQLAAGEEFGRSQSAVSRLLKRFERWRGGAKPEDLGDLDAIRQQHLDRWLARQRHDEVYTRAMRLAKKMEEEPAKTHREGARDGKAWHEDVTRDQLAAAGQMLKTALRANESLSKLADNTVAAAEIEVDRERLLGILKKLRQEAEEAGRVPRSGTSSTADIWLQALVGEDQGWQRWHEGSDHEALLQLIDSVLTSRCGLEDAMNKLRAGGSQESGAVGWVQSAERTQTHAEELSTDTEPQAADLNPQSAIANPELEPAPTHKTHRRIFVGGHPPVDTSRVSLDPSPAPVGRWDPCRGGGRVVMNDPDAGKKYGEPHDAYADDPLGRLYRRIEERLRREAREARLRAAGGG